jgi:hypothetical protein
VSGQLYIAVVLPLGERTPQYALAKSCGWAVGAGMEKRRICRIYIISTLVQLSNLEAICPTQNNYFYLTMHTVI